MIKNFYRFNSAAGFLVLLLLAQNLFASVGSSAPFKNVQPQEKPSAPLLQNEGQYETDVALWVGAGNNETIELYRSLEPDAGFELIATFPSTTGNYNDRDLRRRTTYYYRARVQREGIYSDYSDVLEVTTLSKFYPPTLTARTLSSTSIELTLTDRSYVDRSYEVRGENHSFTAAHAMLDSGETITIIDDGLLPNATYSYVVDAFLYGEGDPVVPNTATASASTGSTEHTLEEIVLYDWEVRENDVSLWWTNVNPGSQTELYRQNPTTGNFELIAVQDADDDGYLDANLSVRTYYTYRLRAINGDQTSDYTTLTVRTLSENFPPSISAQAIDASTVELTFTDNSYNDLSYYVYVKGDPNEFSQVLEMPDSGRTVVLRHTGAMPNTTYTYAVDMQVDISPRESENLEAIVETSATTPGSPSCAGAGTIEREFWWNFTSTDLSAIPTSREPDKVVTLTQFETDNYQGNSYASRIRGFLCPEVTGTYRLHIASDDQSELYLSTDSHEANKRKIASVSGFTAKGDYTKYPLQVSEEISLVAGQRYYIEVLHRDGGGADFVQVAWTLPGNENPSVIPGSRLIPYAQEPEPVACANTGKLQWEVWRNFTGTLDNVPTDTPPDHVADLTTFETPQYFANSYASRAYGYICPPQTGDYVFYLASDDGSRLFLSTDASPVNKVKIAEVTGATGFNQWDKYPTQQSAVIRLQQGQKYYVEVLHREIGGNDFLRVGWKLPDGTLQRPIPGSSLMPYTPADNSSPTVAITSPTEGSTFAAPATINIQANASDSDGTIAKVEFFNETAKLGEDASAPYQFDWTNVPAGTYQIRVAATDNAGAVGQAAVTVTVANACAATGTAYREVWFNVPGGTIGHIPADSEPDYWHHINQLETPQYYANDYASRIRGYLCVPATGDYTFMISSDDESELRLSLNEDPAQRAVIAHVPGYSGFRNFNKYPEQRSATIRLTQGNRYYFEILHKESNGNDHVTVGWQLPDGTVEAPIGGNRIIPWGDPAMSASNFADASIVTIGAPESELTVYPNPTATRSITVSLPDDGGNGEAKVQVISMKGTVIFDKILKCNGGCGNLPISLDESTAAGIYMVNVHDGRKRSSTKLIIE